MICYKCKEPIKSNEYLTVHQGRPYCEDCIEEFDADTF